MLTKEEIRQLPKGELHVHLNGLVTTEIIRRILEEENVLLPEGLNMDDLNVLQPAKDLQQYLKPWHLLRLIPSSKRNLKLIVDNAFYNLKNDNIKFVEIRNSVLYIALNCGITVEEAMKCLIEEIQIASEKYSITSGLILTVSRGEKSIEDLIILLQAFERLGKPKEVIGLDLAGNEESLIPEKLGDLFKNYEERYDLKVTVHAGETGNVNNILSAINDFGADRIGHGTAAIQNTEIMDLLKQKNVCLEVCPVSNRLTTAVSKDIPHPVCVFLKNDVPFVICSDNPQIHKRGLCDDYFEFYKETNSRDTLLNMYDLQRKFSFLNLS